MCGTCHVRTGLILNQINCEAKRREEWLAERIEQEDDEGEDDDAEEQAVGTPGARIDEYGCNLNKFVCLGGRGPGGWQHAVRTAGWVQVDEMPTQ